MVVTVMPQAPPEARRQFEDFVAQHGVRLLHAAFGLCGDWQHAEDLTQQALIGVARRWEQIADPLAYSYRVLTRANIDRWRVARNRLELAAEPASFAELAIGSDEARIDDHLAVMAALRALPSRQRAIVVLRYLQDLSEAETANALGISIGAVKSGASRGLARLRTATRSEEPKR